MLDMVHGLDQGRLYFFFIFPTIVYLANSSMYTAFSYALKSEHHSLPVFLHHVHCNTIHTYKTNHSYTFIS